MMAFRAALPLALDKKNLRPAALMPSTQNSGYSRAYIHLLLTCETLRELDMQDWTHKGPRRPPAPTSQTNGRVNAQSLSLAERLGDPKR